MGLDWFRGCKGLQPSKVRNGHWSFDRDLEGVQSLGAVLAEGSFVLLQKGMEPMDRCWQQLFQ